MQVRFGIRLVAGVEREVVVDDHVDLKDVDSPRDNVRRDEDLGLAVPERLHHRVALARLELAVERGDLVSFRRHASGDLVGGVASLADGASFSSESIVGSESTDLDKDDTLANGEKVIELDENLVLVGLVSAVCRVPNFSEVRRKGPNPHAPMKNCLIASRLSSSCFRRISLALGAKRAAKLRTESAKVAEKRTI